MAVQDVVVGELGEEPCGRESVVGEIAEQSGVGGYERDVQVVGEGDEFAVVGGAGGLGDER